MSHRFFLKNLYDFSYSVFNEHSLNFRQGHLAFTKLLRYLNLFKYLRRSVISPKELFSFFLGSSGLEPPTSRLSGARSNQLSYEPIWNRVRWPDFGLVEMMGFEPMTPCLQGRCSPNWATPPFGSVALFSFNELLSLTENWTTTFVRFVLLSDNLWFVICSSP